MKYLSSLFLLLVLALYACAPEGQSKTNVGFSVTPQAETAPVKSRGDAADDPAIWVHPDDPAKSLVFATDKLAGIYAYDLKGIQKAFYPIGEINNIDVLHNVVLDSQKIDILCGTNQSLNTLEIFGIDPKSGILRSATAEALFSQTQKVYGICLYHSPKDSQAYAFVGGYEGEIEQWQLLPAKDGHISAKIVREFRLPGKSEGMVADHERGYIYVAQETNAIWRIPAEPDTDGEDYFLVTSLEGNPNLKADLEGLALYRAKNEEGFLIVSSQGNHSFAIFKRKAPYPYLGSFHIEAKEDIDEVSMSDGIEVINQYMGEDFPLGMFVTQDGENLDPMGRRQSQNFKFLRWEDIADSLGIHTIIDTTAFVKR